MIALAFMSGIAFSCILLWIWSLCRASADADRLMEMIDKGDEPC